MPFELHFTRIFWKSQFAKSSVSRIITKALIYDIYSSIVIIVIIIVISIIIVIISISNSNWTEWSTIQGVIARVISKSDEREARGRFEITSTITPWIVRHKVQLLINRIYNKFRN